MTNARYSGREPQAHRQYFPKGKSMAGYSQADLDAVADQLNGRPRHTLGWKTPSQTLEQALR